ncbi:hypothetical protein, partial [Bradyrhizobium sp.]|uniref:hypothetical protein n=1 Tax=Bradyrhizobium sp. TaxID=376 RepID=UPI003C74EA47
HSIAHTLPAGHPAAVVPIDRGGDRAAALSRANDDAAGANADGCTRIPSIAMGALVTVVSVAIGALLTVVSVATHLDVDLGHFQIFRLGRENPAK